MTASLIELFDRSLADMPYRTAFLVGGEPISYAALDARVRDRARRLAADGVRAGHRVGVPLPPGPDAVVAALATWRRGAVVVFEKK